ncbi:DUF418 domain-containing protein [Peribacillus butanolivorans]|uniref:DUF418 domain-containing protein n=1 Tax=Peribacillus butanolivorans TaxID=421767 RepID=UPI002E2070B6|nr:DUF418 domain-containing protein [Peribacillus butanolivorans]
MNSNRIKLIDSLRGFSLLGILMANLLIFQYGIWGKDEINIDTLSKLDVFSLQFIKIAFESTFLPIFSLLFGYSLIKLVESIKERRNKSRWHLIRRGIGLLVIGIIHSTYIWEGDILTFYGLMLFVLLPFIHRKAKTLLIWSAILVVLLGVLSYGENVSDKTEQAEMQQFIEETNNVYANGTYMDILDYRKNAMPPGFEDPIFIFFLLLLSPIFMLPMFLLGMAMAKRQYFINPAQEKRSYLLGWLFFPVGLVLKLLAYKAGLVAYSAIFTQVGGQLLAIGYILIFSFLYSKFSNKFIFTALESMGKLSLSNYLMQSIICTLIFYGYGLGFYNHLGVFYSIILGGIIFCIQCGCSILYVRFFRRGLIEHFLRVWTNLSLSGNIRKSAHNHMDNSNLKL